MRRGIPDRDTAFRHEHGCFERHALREEPKPA